MAPKKARGTQCAPKCIVAAPSRKEYARLEAKYHATLKLAAQIRSQQNALLLVHRLPHDVLWVIFSFLIQPTSDTEPRANEVVRASRVCTRWREVTASPSLWTHISVRTIEQTTAYLERSQAMLIRITVGTVSAKVLKALPALLEPHLHRIRELNLCGPRVAADIRRWVTWLGAPAAALESLTLVLKDDPPAETAWAGDQRTLAVLAKWPFVGDNEFGGHLTHLRSLTLHGVYFPPTSPIFKHLSHLRLSGQPPQHLRTSTAIVQILARLPGLETLWLSHIGSPLQEPSADNRSFSVSLPRLQEITMRDVALDFPGNVFDAITVPDTARLDLCVSTTHSDALWSLPHRTRDIAPLLSALTGIRALDVELDGRYRNNGTIVFRTRRDPASPEPDATLELRAPRIYTRLSPSRHTCALFESSALERLSIRYAAALRTTESMRWGEVLRGIPGLRALEVSDCPDKHMGDLLHELARELREHAEGHRARVCPLLESACVHGVQCTGEFWRQVRDVVAARRGVLKMVRITHAAGLTDAKQNAVREIEGMVETFELHTMAENWLGRGVSDLDVDAIELSDDSASN